MRICYDGVSFEFERRPMPERRFKALCLLAAGGLYVKLAEVVATLCGFLGLLALLVMTIVVVLAIAENGF